MKLATCQTSRIWDFKGVPISLENLCTNVIKYLLPPQVLLPQCKFHAIISILRMVRMGKEFL